MDEATKQLIGEVREPLPARPGEVERCDCEYVRNGTATLFVAVDPVGGMTRGHGHRSSLSHRLGALRQELLDGRYREVDTVTLVMDQLNTHSTAGLYEAFEPGEDKRLTDKLEIQYMLKYRVVAQHRRDRAERTEPAMPRPQDRRHRNPQTRGRNLEGHSK